MSKFRKSLLTVLTILLAALIVPVVLQSFSWVKDANMYNSLKENGVSVTAQIAAINTESIAGFDYSYYPVYSFEGADNTVFFAQDNMIQSFLPDAYQVGDTATVYYDAANPSVVATEGAIPMFFDATSVILGAGILFITMLISALVRNRRRAKTINIKARKQSAQKKTKEQSRRVG